MSGAQGSKSHQAVHAVADQIPLPTPSRPWKETLGLGLRRNPHAPRGAADANKVETKTHHKPAKRWPDGPPSYPWSGHIAVPVRLNLP